MVDLARPLWPCLKIPYLPLMDYIIRRILTFDALRQSMIIPMFYVFRTKPHVHPDQRTFSEALQQMKRTSHRAGYFRTVSHARQVHPTFCNFFARQHILIAKYVLKKIMEAYYTAYLSSNNKTLDEYPGVIM